jgi:DNA-binding PadR family transcriptional regulator
VPVEAKIPKDITPQIAVLSLVVQQADSVAGISRRLREQFPVAQFPASSAHNNLKSLAEAGYVRLMEQGTETSWNRYEATAAGKEFARQWVMRSSLPPMMRDPLQGKLAFAECGEIAPLICLLE